MGENENPVEDILIFRPLSVGQKKDCINNSAEHTCANPAVLEAVYGEGNFMSIIRCCEEPKCKARAAEIAIFSYGRGWYPRSKSP